MKKHKSTLNNLSQKEPVSSNDSGSGLAIGLSLGILFGILTDNLGPGMMISTAAGLCAGSAGGAWRRKKAQEDHQDEKQP